MLRVDSDLLAFQRKNEEDADKVKTTKGAFSRNKFVGIPENNYVGPAMS